MEIIGFIAIIVLGCYLLFAGAAMQIVTAGFSGKNSGFGFIIFAIGVAILYLAWYNKPFSIVFK